MKCYTRHEVADMLSMSLSTVDRHIRRGQATSGADGLWPILRPTRRCTRIPQTALDSFFSRSCPLTTKGIADAATS